MIISELLKRYKEEKSVKEQYEKDIALLEFENMKQLNKSMRKDGCYCWDCKFCHRLLKERSFTCGIRDKAYMYCYSPVNHRPAPPLNCQYFRRRKGEQQ